MKVFQVQVRASRLPVAEVPLPPGRYHWQVAHALVNNFLPPSQAVVLLQHDTSNFASDRCNGSALVVRPVASQGTESCKEKCAHCRYLQSHLQRSWLPTKMIFGRQGRCLDCCDILHVQSYRCMIVFVREFLGWGRTIRTSMSQKFPTSM